MALHKKLDMLQALGPSIAIVPECARPEIIKKNHPEFKFHDADWVGVNKHKGLGVFSFLDYSFARHSLYTEKFHQYLPLIISDADGHIFNLLAVWSFNHRNELKEPGHPTTLAFNHYRPFTLQKNSVVAGDFNNATIWDKPSGQNNMADTIARLEEQNLISAYHSFNSCLFGNESDSTHFWRKGELEFHIDYCFIPVTSVLTNVEIGQRNDWVKFSDHAPVIVDLEFKASAT